MKLALGVSRREGKLLKLGGRVRFFVKKNWELKHCLTAVSMLCFLFVDDFDDVSEVVSVAWEE